MIAFITPVSSSMLRNTNPLAVPGRCRTITDPAMRTSRPFGTRARSRRRSHSQRIHLRPPVSHGMLADGHARAAEIGRQPLFGGHARQRRSAFGRLRAAPVTDPPAAPRARAFQSASRRWICCSGFSAPISASLFISSLRSSGTRSARSSTLLKGRSPARARWPRAACCAQSLGHSASPDAAASAVAPEPARSCTASPISSHPPAARAARAAAHP